MWSTVLILLQRVRDRVHASLGAAARRWLVPFLLITIASAQLGRVFFSGQSRWRGGGFGMYSEFHPNLTQLWLVDLGPSDTRATTQRLSEKDAAPEVARLVGRCMRLRSRTCLQALAAVLPPSSTPARGRRLELWLPTFDAATGTLTRRLKAELDL
jgi:hypothetical protein